LRTLLVLSRGSNLPTVWADCLAAWRLGGQGNTGSLVCVATAASFLYLGGMFLNDAFDAVFDSHHRRTRPIPSGAIAERAVWQWGILWLGVGLTAAVGLGPEALIWAAALCVCILAYNAVHKWTPLAPFLMGMCRFNLYLLAGSASQRGINGEVVWKGLALAAYIVGLSCLARKESSRTRLNFWPALLLATPLVFAALFDDDRFSWMPAIVYSLVLVAWTMWALSRSIGQAEPNVGSTVSRLLAGIVLVDLLAVASGSEPWIGCFGVWFVLSLLLQRFIPAT
jgi:hypothetical protein